MRGQLQRADKPDSDKRADQQSPYSCPKQRRCQGEYHCPEGTQHKTCRKEATRPVSIRQQSRRNLHHDVGIEVQRRKAS